MSSDKGPRLTGRGATVKSRPKSLTLIHFASCWATPPNQGEETIAWCLRAQRADLSSNPSSAFWGLPPHLQNRKHHCTFCQCLLERGRRIQWSKPHSLGQSLPHSKAPPRELPSSSLPQDWKLPTMAHSFCSALDPKLQSRRHKLWVHGLCFILDTEHFHFCCFSDQHLKIGRFHRKNQDFSK